MENCNVTQSRLLIKQWSFGFIESSPLMCSKIHEKLFWFDTRVLFSTARRTIILLISYDSCWQHQMSVCALRHDRPTGRFSKCWGLSTSVSFLSSPPPLRYFSCAIFRTVFDSRSSFFAHKPHGNACYAGYKRVRDHFSRICNDKHSDQKKFWNTIRLYISSRKKQSFHNERIVLKDNGGVIREQKKVA